jgi:hypothetical protein
MPEDRSAVTEMTLVFVADVNEPRLVLSGSGAG